MYKYDSRRVSEYAIRRLHTPNFFGRYRRGKSESNDVDIVITHTDADKVKGLCTKLVKRLFERSGCTRTLHDILFD